MSSTALVLSTLVPALFAQANGADGASHADRSRHVLITSAGQIGTLDATTTPTEEGVAVDVDFRIDDNGRGPKLREHVELGRDGLPRKWTVEGRGGVGAPVKEEFAVADGKARWKSLDDAGEAPAEDGLYVPNSSSPWELELFARVLLRSKELRHAVLPSGSIRLERLRDVQIGVGANKETVSACALWGLQIAPAFVLLRGDRLVANLDGSGDVLVEERHRADFDALQKLGTELSTDALRTISKRLTHRIEVPLWLLNVRVFDPVAGKVGAPTNVGVFRDTIVHVGGDPPPADAQVVDGDGGTLLPGLFDSHLHLGDWDGPLHVACGVTLGRDPGNDNESLLLLEKRIAAGELIGPRMKNSGFLEGKSPYSAHLGFVVDSRDEALEKVRWYADHGFWGVKIYNSMNPDFVAAIAAEAHRLGLHVSGHVPAFMSSERAIRDGYDEINHVNQLMLSFVIDPLKEDTRTPFRFTALGERLGTLDLASEPVRRVFAMMKERGTALDPTVATFSELLMSRPGTACPADAGWLDHMPASIQRGRRSATLDVKPEQYPLYDASWRKVEETLRTLHGMGITLVPGTDDFAGFVLHSELECWVKAGIPPADALRSATLGGARFLGLDHELGTVERGKLAELYLVAGDPTREIGDLRKGRLVLTNGAFYYPDEIEAALEITPFAPRALVHEPSARPAGAPR